MDAMAGAAENFTAIESHGGTTVGGIRVDRGRVEN